MWGEESSPKKKPNPTPVLQWLLLWWCSQGFLETSAAAGGSHGHSWARTGTWAPFCQGCEGADGNIPAHVPTGILLSSPFSPGRQKEPGIPLQRVPSVDVRGRVPPTRGWMSLICFSRPNIPQRKFVGMAEGFAVHARKTALDFFFYFSLLCFGCL